MDLIDVEDIKYLIKKNGDKVLQVYTHNQWGSGYHWEDVRIEIEE